MKRILALMLTLCLVLSLVPANVVTAVGTEQTQTQDTTVSDSTPVPESAIVPEEETQTQPVLGAPAGHSHYACSCALEGGNACAGHGTEAAVTYVEWTDGTRLPTEGNWYLAQNVVLTNTAAIEIASGTVNLCLNGFSIQFNAANTAAANIHVASGATLNIVNCQAVLDAKGLFVSGNKANTADLTAGRLQGGRGNAGGALCVEGLCTVIGVELYDNKCSYGGAIRVQKGGVLNTVHAKFDSNNGSCGAAIGNWGSTTSDGAANITLDDTILSNNTANPGGAIYLRRWQMMSAPATLVIRGDSLLTGNSSGTGSGGAIYAASYEDTTNALNPVITLQDNVVITNNTTGSAKGAVAVDQAVVQVSGNVQIAGNKTTNTGTGAVALNSVFSDESALVVMGDLGPNARIGLRSDMASSLATRVKAADGVTLTETAYTGIFVEKTTEVGYAASGFYAAASSHKHYNGACTLTGEQCAHTDETEVTYQPWFDTTKLPTAGNWYLVYDVVATGNQVSIGQSATETLNLCLNGHSIQFNSANTGGANYYLYAKCTASIMNCQAKLNDKNQLECGNKNDPTNVQAGRLFGGRGLYGGAMYVKGALTLIGVEFYDNQALNTTEGFGGALRVQENAKVVAKSVKFDSNKAAVNGGAIATGRGGAEVYLQDTVFSNNSVTGVANNTYSGRGGAIYMNSNIATSGTLSKDATLTITGNSVLSDNKTEGTNAKQGGAIAVYATATGAYKDVVNIQGNTVITKNTAKGNGGAIYMAQATTGATELNISDKVQITHNTGGDAGGAIYARKDGTGATPNVNITGSVQITDNKATRLGGAICIANAVLNTNGTTFARNKASMGGAIANDIGNAWMNLHDTVITEHTGISVGAGVYLKTWKGTTTTEDPTLTISGNSRIFGNSSTGSGSAIYTSRDATDATTPANGAPAGITCQVILKDNVQITDNTSAGTNGAVVMDSTDAGVANGIYSYLDVSGNVVIDNNTNTQNPMRANADIGYSSMANVGVLGDQANVHVYTPANKADPDEFLVANGITGDTTATGITYDNYNLAVGYDIDPDANVKFTFNHIHAACSCALQGGNACGTVHGAEWQPWTDATKLPNATSTDKTVYYYLTSDITVAATGQTSVTAGFNVNICLNGYSIKFNEGNTAAANYYVYAGGELNIMNCQAVLDTDGLFVSGNQADANDLTAGRLFGGRGLYGGAMYVKGTLNVIGVEFYDNRAEDTTEGFGGAIRIQDGGTLNTVHTKFTDNYAKVNGGAIAIGRGNTVITLDDTILTGNETAGKGGAIYQNADSPTASPLTKNPTLILKGDTLITENESGAQGGAIALNRSANVPAGMYPELTIQDRTTIEKNYAKGNGGALYIGMTGDLTAPVIVNVAGDVVVDGNTSDGNGDNLYLWANANQPLVQKLQVGEMGANAKVNVNLGPTTAFNDADDFLLVKDSVQIADTSATGIVFGETKEPVAYSAANSFNFNHVHGACECEVTGDATCTAHQDVEFAPWTNASSLPTKGNWYLICDVVVTSTSPVKLEENDQLNLCMNGYSIQFNPDIAKTTNQTNYYVNVGAEMSIINCQAKLDENGLLVCGDKKDTTNEKAGRLFGGRGLYGGAIYVKGTLTVIGVEFYDNQANITKDSAHIAEGSGGALRVQSGGVLRSLHSKFDSNKALINGGAIAATQGDVEIYLDDTILTNNESIGVYTDKDKKLYTTNLDDQGEPIDGRSIDEGKGRGGAIYFAGNHLTTAGNDITKAPVLEITGNTLIQGNTTNGTTGNQGGAIAIVNTNPNGYNLQVTIKDDVQILDNTARAVGGAIYVNQGGKTGAPKITISDNVKINGNTSTKGNAGAIYINNSAAAEVETELTITDKVQINNNTSAIAAAGAIYIAQNGTKKAVKLNISGEVQINGNEAKGSSGGAIYLTASKSAGDPIVANISGKVQISGNKASADGGAIVVHRDSVLNISDSVQIVSNEAGNRGGAIFMHRPSDTAKGEEPALSISDNVVITKNKATGNGGGVYIGADDYNVPLYLTVSGNVQIKGNETGKNGPNVYLWGNCHVGQPLAQKIKVGQLTSKAEVYVTVSLGNANLVVNDPDEFLVLADGVKLEDTKKSGIIYESIDPPVYVGYGNDKNTQFYFAGEYVAHEDHALCICAVTGDASCKNNTTLQWTAWAYTDKLPTATGNYYLSKDVVITSTSGGSIGCFEVKDGAKVNLCLNGYSITFAEKNTGKANYYAMVGSELNIINCKAVLDKENKLVSGEALGGQITGGRGMYGGAIYNKGTMTLIGVAFRDNQATHKTEGMGGAIRVQDGGKLTVQSCLFDGNTATTSGGAIATGRNESIITIQDSVFTKNKAAANGGALGISDTKNKETVTLTVENSVFSENEANNGGGVYMAKANAKLTNVLINKNTAKADAAGLYANASNVVFEKGVTISNNTGKNSGGFVLQAKTVLDMKDAIIEGNTANNAAGGILWSESILNMSGGEIRNNTTKGNGGGLYLQGGTTLNLSGGKISKNEAAKNGGGLYVNKNDDRIVTVNMTGGEISENTANNGSGVYHSKSIGNYTGGTITKNISKTDAGGIYARENAEITIDKDFVLSENFGKSGGGFVTQLGAVLNIKGGIIENNTANNGGAGILWSQSSVNMSGGIVRGNSVTQRGGAFYLQGQTTFNLSGGSITGNKAVTYGGAFSSIKQTKDADGCTINITGGEITKNEAMGKLDTATGKYKEGYGGGIYIKQGYINLNGGTIAENKANYAGGVFFNTTKFTFTKGTVTKNYAKTNGGGISSSQFSELIMDGPEAVVSYNTSDGPAGGILIQGRKTSTLDGKSITKDYGSTMTMTNGQVYGNTAKSQGGGIFVSTESRAIIKGGSITGNTTKEQSGGGMYQSKGEILIYGGYFAKNDGFYAGGAIQASAGKLHVYGGTFENNTAKNGGAIRTYNFTDTYIGNATFVDNRAYAMAGAIALQSDTTIENCTFKGNSALREEGTTNECDGGAIYVWGGSDNDRPSYEVTVKDCLFEENVADTLGGAMGVTTNCTLNVSDCIFKNNKSNDRGGAIATINGRSQRRKIAHLNVDECEFITNEAVNDGGAVYCSYITENHLTNSTFTDNTAGRDGGAIYTRKQSDAWIDNCQITGSSAGQRGAAIFVGDNAELSNITVTGNKSGDTYAVYIDKGGYDGDSYVRALIKLYGDIIIGENEGSKQDMFIADKALVNIGYQGLGENTKFGVELANGVLTNTLIGAYNYEGGDLKYVVTYGDRSVTDPEPIPVAEPEVEDTTPATEPTATGDAGKQASFSIGGVIAISAVLVVAVIAVLAAVVVKKKKKAEESAKDTVQE